MLVPGTCSGDPLPYVLHRTAGPEADLAAPPDLLIEVPHAAWRTAHFTAVAERLRGTLPPDLIDFFFVNTDVGAEDVALALASALVEAEPTRSALVLACRVPRTFIDCNRVLDAADGSLTPGLAPYVRDPADQALLAGLHRRYVEAADLWVDRVCGGGGIALSLHTYAPRSVPIARITDTIVEDLHRVYAPEVADTWPPRPQVDLISTDAEGRRVLADRLVEPCLHGFAALGLDVAEGGTYHLHPATQAARFAQRHPGRTLCLELRRDLLVRQWTPFAEMQIDPDAAARLAGPLLVAVRAGLS